MDLYCTVDNTAASTTTPAYQGPAPISRRLPQLIRKPLATVSRRRPNRLFAGIMKTANLALFYYFIDYYRSEWELWKQHSLLYYTVSVTSYAV